MKSIAYLGAALAFALAGCNQGGQQAALSGQPAAPGGAVVAQDDMQSQPPIYNPLVDMHGKSPQKFAKDHAECRRQAEPQERAARQAQANQGSGLALSVVGTVLGGTVGAAAQQIGDNVQNGASVNNANATQDYALVINNCLSRRGYFLLRT